MQHVDGHDCITAASPVSALPPHRPNRQAAAWARRLWLQRWPLSGAGEGTRVVAAQQTLGPALLPGRPSCTPALGSKPFSSQQSNPGLFFHRQLPGVGSTAIG